jgi:hypothetical protein
MSQTIGTKIFEKVRANNASETRKRGSSSAHFLFKVCDMPGDVSAHEPAAVLFGFGVLALPSATRASLVLLFAAYVASDGVFAILAGTVRVGRLVGVGGHRRTVSR